MAASDATSASSRRDPQTATSRRVPMTATLRSAVAASTTERPILPTILLARSPADAQALASVAQVAPPAASRQRRENAAVAMPLEHLLHALDGGRADRVLHHAGVDLG